MKLKKWVSIDLWRNSVHDEWAEYISKMNMEKWVILNLKDNYIGDDGVESIIDNMKMKEWVTIDLSGNPISDKMKRELKIREKSYRQQWIYCKIIV